mgnify:FL=1
MQKIFAYILLCLVFTACVTNDHVQKKETPQSIPPPEWVSQRPISNQYYIGIASSNKKVNPVDYAAIAKKNALSDMASSVSVRVQGQSFLNTMEVNKVFSEDFSSNINTTTDISFEDYETVGSYENDQEYFIYLRISKSAYQEQQNRKKSEAIQQAYQLYERASESQKRNQMGSAIDLLLHALFAIKPYWSETNHYITPSGEDLLLDQQIYSDIEQIMAGLQITSVEQGVLLGTKNQFSQSVAIKAIHNGNLAIGVPVTVHFPTSKYTRPKKMVSGPDGKWIVNVQDVPLESKSPQLEVKLDIDALIASDLDEKICKRLLSATPVNALMIPIHILKPTFCIQSVEKEFGNNNQQQLLAIAVQSFLAQQGFTAAPANKADYIIEIEANTTAAGQTQDFSSALLDLKLTLKDNQEELVRYQNNTNTIKGVQLNTAAAGAEAYKKAKILLEDEWLKLMLQAIL